MADKVDVFDAVVKAVIQDAANRLKGSLLALIGEQKGDTILIADLKKRMCLDGFKVEEKKAAAVMAPAEEDDEEPQPKKKASTAAKKKDTGAAEKKGKGKAKGKEAGASCIYVINEGKEAERVCGKTGKEELDGDYYCGTHFKSMENKKSKGGKKAPAPKKGGKKEEGKGGFKAKNKETEEDSDGEDMTLTKDKEFGYYISKEKGWVAMKEPKTLENSKETEQYGFVGKRKERKTGDDAPGSEKEYLIPLSEAELEKMRSQNLPIADKAEREEFIRKHNESWQKKRAGGKVAE